MSAFQIRFDWRVQRAAAVLQTGVVFDFAHYAEIFDMDEEETIEVFQEAAYGLGIPFCVDARAPALH